MAVYHGGTLPIRAAVLDVAEKWGTPPWLIAPDLDMTPLQWFVYQQKYSALIYKRMHPNE